MGLWQGRTIQNNRFLRITRVPSRRNASLEPDESKEDDMFGSLSVGGLTDNSGNRFAVARMMSTKWPLSAFVSELAAQLEARGLLFELQWIPREQNAEADAITNGDFTWLNPLRRVEAKLEDLPVIVLPTLLKDGALLYKDIDTLNVGCPPVAKLKRLLKIKGALGLA